MTAPRRRRPVRRAPNPSREQLATQVARFARNTEPGMRVLDAGAGRSPYRHLFDHAHYEAADFAQLSTKYAPLDYVCDLTDIPVEDGRFDRILFNQVLEHLPDPAAAVQELHRVLRPGGRLMCSAPLFYAEHQVPYDFFRYTRFGLRRLFEDAGFEVVRLVWLEGYLATSSYQLDVMSRALPTDPRQVRAAVGRKRALYLTPLLWLTARLAGAVAPSLARADGRWKYTKAGMPKNYLLVVRRPAAPPAGQET
ncbi:class I SAM-dependent methyltransferase [Nocardioides aurantiacus]|uniref:Ubiquinone/menaquinone biosynthesis C-methylase UbiE n=1 Tax=Nocardioides aurantiacus TaxID=86796 RepID=A0A3N2CQU2_9ACTN|nr:class I SAM-dependent methyltransferase [Nocardioides aurantiacus]ROR89778.1 ubiquinone/menaquinone biosynthesis C-methylase UbiE [Nocardioides aurantiacus]